MGEPINIKRYKVGLVGYGGTVTAYISHAAMVDLGSYADNCACDHCDTRSGPTNCTLVELAKEDGGGFIVLVGGNDA